MSAQNFMAETLSATSGFNFRAEIWERKRLTFTIADSGWWCQNVLSVFQTQVKHKGIEQFIYPILRMVASLP